MYISTKLGSVVVCKALWCVAFIWWHTWVYLWASTELLFGIRNSYHCNEGQPVSRFFFLHIVASRGKAWASYDEQPVISVCYLRACGFPEDTLHLVFSFRLHLTVFPFTKTKLSIRTLPWWCVSLIQQSNSHPGTHWLFPPQLQKSR